MIRLFHVSDVHFGCEDPAAVAWFDEKVAAVQPDAVIMTGDLTMRARGREWSAGAKWLEGLHRPVTLEPGNHDLPYFNLWARFLTPYRRFTKVEAMIEKPLEIKGVAVVPLKTTARFQLRTNWSKGLVSGHALRKTVGLVAAIPEGNVTLVAAHHPLIEAGTRATSQTRGGRRALEALAAAGVNAVLTGHVHDPFDIPHEVGGRTVRLIGAGTLSRRTRARRASFNELVIEGTAITVTVHELPLPEGVEPHEIPAGALTEAHAAGA